MKKRILSFMAALAVGFGMAPSMASNVYASTETKAETSAVEVKMPEFPGQAMDQKAAEDRIKAAQEKIKEFESADLKINVEAMAFSVTGEGSINLKDNKAYATMTLMGNEMSLYVDGADMYQLQEEEWKHSTLKEDEQIASLAKGLKEAKPVTVDPKVWEFLEAIETPEGDMVLKNKMEINAENLKKMIPEGADFKEISESLKTLTDSGAKLNFAIVYDKDNVFKAVYAEGSATMGSGDQKMDINFVVEALVENYNSANPIEVPTEALDSKKQ